jgi:putative ABC transport system permease protein
VPVEDDARSPRTSLAVERTIAPNYFQAMGIPLVRGRAFLSSEDFTSDAVVVNAAFARTYFSGREVIGRRLYSKELGPSKPLQIVGVVGDSLESPTDDAPQPTIYLRSFSNWLDLLVRADRPLEAVGPVLRFVRSQDQSIPVDQIEILDDAVQSPLGQSKTQALLSTAFAIASIVLAGAGLYAVVRHTGDARKREYAIRIAIGATEARLIKLRLRQTARTVGIGLVSGIAGAVAFGRIVQSMFFRVPAFDALMLASATLILLAVAVAASYPSIKDTTTLDPSELLRSS